MQQVLRSCAGMKNPGIVPNARVYFSNMALAKSYLNMLS
jgi:hypothetical protein